VTAPKSSGKEIDDAGFQIVHRAAILMAPLVTIAASTGLSLRILTIVSSTFFRATFG